MQALKHPAAGVRKAAAMVLPRNAEVARALVPLLQDPDLHTRLAATLAIADMPASPEIGQAIYRASQQADNFGTNMLSEFKNFQQAKPGDPLFDKGLAVLPEGQFEFDARNDQLPTVSWLLPPAGFDEHPNASPAAGATYVAAKLDALAANPEVWAKTVFILSYDENDGYFDHAPSFAAADPKRPETGGASAGIDTGLEYCYKEDELRQGGAANEALKKLEGFRVDGIFQACIIGSPQRRVFVQCVDGAGVVGQPAT